MKSRKGRKGRKGRISKNGTKGRKNVPFVPFMDFMPLFLPLVRFYGISQNALFCPLFTCQITSNDVIQGSSCRNPVSGISRSRLKAGSKLTFRLGCKSFDFLVQKSQLIDVFVFISWKQYFIGRQRRDGESIRSGNTSTENKFCLTYGVPRSKDRGFSSRDLGADHMSITK